MRGCGYSAGISTVTGTPLGRRAISTWWNIIVLPRILRGRGEMGLPRSIRTLLFGCNVFCMVVFACAGNAAAQSHPLKSPNPGHSASGHIPTERADIARFRGRVEAALAASGPDKGTWGVLVTDTTTGDVLYERNAGTYFTPASDAKLFTTALALAT